MRSNPYQISHDVSSQSHLANNSHVTYFRHQYPQNPYSYPSSLSIPSPSTPFTTSQGELLYHAVNPPRVQPVEYSETRELACKFCSGVGCPIIVQKVGSTAIIYAICLLLTTLILFWLPLCLDSCKDTHYVCKHCHVILATKKVTCL